MLLRNFQRVKQHLERPKLQTLHQLAEHLLRGLGDRLGPQTESPSLQPPDSSRKQRTRRTPLPTRLPSEI